MQKRQSWSWSRGRSGCRKNSINSRGKGGVGAAREATVAGQLYLVSLGPAQVLKTCSIAFVLLPGVMNVLTHTLEHTHTHTHTLVSVSRYINAIIGGPTMAALLWLGSTHCVLCSTCLLFMAFAL